MITPSLRAILAPAGTLRVGINYANPVLAKRNPADGELSGVAVDLARELARRAGLPLDLVPFGSAGKLFEGIKSGACDAAFLALDPTRAEEVEFTSPYVEIEGTYLVTPASPFAAIGDVDRAGVRVGVSANSAYDLFLSRTLKHAELTRAPDPDAAFALILAGKVDVVAGVRQHLESRASEIAGGRVLDGRFMAIEQALGIPRNREAAASFLREFIEDAKACGFVARALARAGVKGVSVAPPAANSESRRDGKS